MKEDGAQVEDRVEEGAGGGGLLCRKEDNSPKAKIKPSPTENVPSIFSFAVSVLTLLVLVVFVIVPRGAVLLVPH